MISMFPANLSSIIRETGNGKIEKRSLGKTGEKLSFIGFGGIVVMNATTDQAASRVKEAVDYGVNYFDVAPSGADLLINLAGAIPTFHDQFTRIAEIVPNQESAKANLREHWTTYKSLGYELKHHEL